MENAGSLTDFDDPKLADNYDKRDKTLKFYKSGRTVDFETLDELQVHDEFVEYMEMGGFTWLLFLESHNLPSALVDEFFTTYRFEVTTDLFTPSVHFRLFNIHYNMSLHEWSVRLGLYSMKEIINGEATGLECGLPGKDIEVDLNEAWVKITGRKGIYHYARAFGQDILDPVLRLCQAFLVTNLIGMSTAYSRIPAATLYFIWCIVRGVRVHLGFWVAYQINAVSRRPSRHFTLCHFLEKFIRDNFDFGDSPSPMAANPQVPLPKKFNMEFLRDAGLIHILGDGPRFYTVGESPNMMISRRCVGGGQVRSSKDNKAADKRLKKLENKLTVVQIAHEEVTRELRETRAAQAQGQKDLKADLERLVLIVGQLAQLQPQPAPAPSAVPEPAPGKAPAPPPPAASAHTPCKRRGW